MLCLAFIFRKDLPHQILTENERCENLHRLKYKILKINFLYDFSLSLRAKNTNSGFYQPNDHFIIKHCILV